MDDTNDLLTILEQEPELIKLDSAQVNVTALDSEDNTEEMTSKILEDYTNLELEKEQKLKKLEDFKELHKDIFQYISEIEVQISDIDYKQSNVKKKLLDKMEETQTKMLIGSKFKVTYIAPTKRHNFDTDKFKKKYPVLYNQFLKVSDVKSYIKLSEV